MNPSRPLVVIAGGGTAGHTNPGIAVAQALVERGLGTEQVRFIGGVRGNEGRLVAEAGFAIDLLPGRGIERKVSVQNLRTARDLAAGSLGAQRLIRSYRPAAVLCLGGYAAFAPSAAALTQRRPVVVSEQNAVPSAVNELIGKGAAACAVPFESCDLPRKVVTGNPIRSEVVDALSSLDRDQARAALGVVPGRLLVASWSGSLGSSAVNRAVAGLAQAWRDRSDLELYHVVGERDWEEFGSAGETAGRLRYRTVAYEDSMPLLLKAADVVICRAGASTVAELAAVGIPAVLVPLPGAPRDHQQRNAEQLADVGAAVVIEQDELDGKLRPAVEELLASGERRQQMRIAGRSVGRPGAAAAVADLLALHGGFS